MKEYHKIQTVFSRSPESQPTSLGEIHERIGKEISKNQVRKTLYKMVHSDRIHRSGNTNGARYYLVTNL